MGQLSIYAKDLLYLEVMTSNVVYRVKPYHMILIMLWKSMNLFQIQPYNYSGFFYVLKLNFVFNVFLSPTTQGFHSQNIIFFKMCTLKAQRSGQGLKGAIIK